MTDNFEVTNTQEDENRNDLMIALIEETLVDLGMSPSLKGFSFMVTMVYNRAKFPGDTFTDTYDRIVKDYGESYSRIERNLRHAIQSMWRICNPQYKQGFFGVNFSSQPTIQLSQFVGIVTLRVINLYNLRVTK